MPKPIQYKLKQKFDANGKKLKPEKRWMIKGYLGLDPKTGLDKYTTLRGFETAQAAKDAYDDAVYEFKHNLRSQPEKKPTVREAYEMWYPMHAPTVRVSTRQGIEQQFRRHILPVFGDYLIDKLTLLDIQPWVNQICTQMVSAPVVVGRLKLLIKFAGGMGWITTDPTSMIVIPRNRKRDSNHPENNVYDINELNAFADALDQDILDGYEYSVERRAFFRTVISTGMRVGEAEGLTWDDVDFSAKTISVNKTMLPNYGTGEIVGPPKTKSGFRTLTVGDDVLATLVQWRNVNNSQSKWVFTSPYDQSRPLAYELPSEWIRKLCERHSLRRITVHGLRHTKATLMAEASINPADIAGALGHSNPKFTMERYVHTTQAGINNASAEFNQLLENSIWSKSGRKII